MQTNPPFVFCLTFLHNFWKEYEKEQERESKDINTQVPDIMIDWLLFNESLENISLLSRQHCSIAVHYIFKYWLYIHFRQIKISLNVENEIFHESWVHRLLNSIQKSQCQLLSVADFDNSDLHSVLSFSQNWSVLVHKYVLTELCSPSCTLTPKTRADNFFRDGVLPLDNWRKNLYRDVSLSCFLGWPIYKTYKYHNTWYINVCTYPNIPMSV